MTSIVLTLLIILLLLVGGFKFLRSRLQDDSVPTGLDFKGDRLLFLFPHPDDEITCAGTIKLLNTLGKETILITLTRGEGGTANGLVDESDPILKKQELGKLRSQELESVSKLLGINHLEILDFPDGGINDIPPEVLKELIKEKIAHYQPNVLITYDDQIGLYGHPDHITVARYVKEMFQQGDLPIEQLYQVTLPKPMIETALAISDSFKQNYPSIAEQGLPSPTMAVKITEFGVDKRDAMLLHRSQKPTFDDMQPYFDKLPPLIYFRIFDKEYFSQVL